MFYERFKVFIRKKKREVSVNAKRSDGRGRQKPIKGVIEGETPGDPPLIAIEASEMVVNPASAEGGATSKRRAKKKKRRRKKKKR